MPANYLLIAGEASGDTYGASIVSKIKELRADYEVFAIGGEKIRACNVNIVESIENLSVMGLTEVLKHIPFILKLLGRLKDIIRKSSPEFIILIDFPDFNFRVAKYAYKYKIPVYYFVSPQIWAWRQSRVFFLKKYIKKIFVLFPFEVDFYKKFDVDVEFVGHPLVEKIHNFSPTSQIDRDFLNIALLPGSRKSEVEKLLPIILESAKLIKERYPTTKFFIPVAPNINFESINGMIGSRRDYITLIKGNSYEVLSSSIIVVAASGTATLEAALFGKPVIIIYKVNMLSYILAKFLIKVPYIGIANLLLGKMYNPELIQNKVTPDNIFVEVRKFIENKLKYKVTSEKNNSLKETLYKEDIFTKSAKAILKI